LFPSIIWRAPGSIDSIFLWLIGGDWRKLPIDDQPHRSFKMAPSWIWFQSNYEFALLTLPWFSTSRSGGGAYATPCVALVCCMLSNYSRKFCWDPLNPSLVPALYSTT
jgi:hypothetical protein